MTPLAAIRRAWSNHRARVAARDAEYARIDREIDAEQIARQAGGPKVIDCDCDSCKETEARVLAYLKERDEAARAMWRDAAIARDRKFLAEVGIDSDSLYGGVL